MEKSSPQRHQMRSSLQNINTNKTGACLGWAAFSASPSCLLFICAFAAIVTFLLLQLIPYSITLCPFSNTYTIHSTGALRCCPPDVWVSVHPQGHFDLETYMFILKCCFFFLPHRTDPCQCLCCAAAVVVTLGYHLWAWHLDFIQQTAATQQMSGWISLPNSTWNWSSVIQ